jgi:hypothetical protein
VGGSIHRQDEGVPQHVQANNAIWRGLRAFLEYRQSPQIFCLNPQGQHALVIHQTVSFRPSLFSSQGVRFLMRRSYVIYQLKSPAKTKTQHIEKDRMDGLRHSTTPKSPRGAALTTLACDNPRKSRLRVQPDQHNKCAKSKSFPKDSSCKSHLRVQPEQHNKCAKSKSFPKDSPCKSRLRVQPEQHNKCDNRSLLQKTLRAKVA